MVFAASFLLTVGIHLARLHRACS